MDSQKEMIVVISLIFLLLSIAFVFASHITNTTNTTNTSNNTSPSIPINLTNTSNTTNKSTSFPVNITNTTNISVPPPANTTNTTNKTNITIPIPPQNITNTTNKTNASIPPPIPPNATNQTNQTNMTAFCGNGILESPEECEFNFHCPPPNRPSAGTVCLQSQCICADANEPVEQPPLIGDLNGDGIVNIIDLVMLATNFGKSVCDSCGNGIFNLCDKTECEGISNSCSFMDGVTLNKCRYVG